LRTDGRIEIVNRSFWMDDYLFIVRLKRSYVDHGTICRLVCFCELQLINKDLLLSHHQSNYTFGSARFLRCSQVYCSPRASSVTGQQSRATTPRPRLLNASNVNHRPSLLNARNLNHRPRLLNTSTVPVTSTPSRILHRSIHLQHRSMHQHRRP
jgi:hypothetical protein